MTIRLPRAPVSDTARQATALAVARGAAVGVMGIGGAVVVGWLFDVPALRSLSPDWAAMQISTALCFIASAVALWLRLPGHRRSSAVVERNRAPTAAGRPQPAVASGRGQHTRQAIAQACASSVALLGSTVLAQHLGLMGDGIDHWLAWVLPAAVPHPIPMAPMTAAGFAAMGTALCLFDARRGRAWAQALTVASAVAATVALLGYVYGVAALYQMGSLSTVALHTALSFILLAVGALCARPERGLVSILASRNAGGLMVRQMMPVAIAMPVLLGWAILGGERAGLYSADFGFAAYAVSLVVVLTTLVLRGGHRLETVDLERSRAEAEREHGRARIAAIIDSAMDAVISIDAEQRIVLFNPAAEKVFRCRASDVIGQGLDGFLPPELHAAHGEHVRGFARAGTTSRRMGVTRAVRAVRADGEEFPVEASISTANADGEQLHTVILRDVTAREQTRIELERARETAETASRAKSEFVAHISHEIRTPLNGILGMADMVLDTELTTEQRDNLELLRASGESLFSVVNDVLDFSKIEAGKLWLEPIEFSLRATVGDVVDLLAVRARQKHLRLTKDVAADVPDVVVGDAGRLRQVLFNLIGNALKFTERGEVAVEVTAVQCGAAPPACSSRSEMAARQIACPLEICFTVRDTGIGIPEEKQRAIFDAFEQADGSTTRKYGGTGLGLSIAKRLVELMNGALSVESVVARGSKFIFTAQFGVPSAKCDVPNPSCDVRALAAAAPRVAPPSAARPCKRILVAEDNPLDQQVITRALAKRDHRVTVVGNGREAVERWKRESFDVLLMDVQMPEMNGLEATAEIRRRGDPRPRVPIIAMTALAMAGDRQRCLAAGMDAYLAKPIRPVELLAAIDALTAAGGPALEASPGPTERGLQGPGMAHGVR